MDNDMKTLVDQRFTDLQRLMDVRFQSIDDGLKRQESVMSGFLERMNDLDNRYVTRETNDLMAEKRDGELDAHGKRIDTLERQVDHLRFDWARMMGVAATVSMVVLVLFEYGKQWLMGMGLH